MYMEMKENYVDFEDIKKKQRLRQIKNLLNCAELSKVQKETILKFQGWCERKGLRLESQRAYLQQLKLLFINTGVKTLGDIDSKIIDKYLLYVSQNYKPKTQTERRKFLLLIIEWHYGKKKEEIKLIKDIEVKKNTNVKLPEEMLSPEEIKKQISVCNNFRDKAIVCLLYETATRKGEFLQLKIKHIDISNPKFGFVTVPMGKTDSRKLPLIFSLPYLRDWLNAHPDKDNPNAPLFVTIGSWQGRALDDGLTLILEKTMRRAKINKNIYPHLYRHSRLTELAKELTEQELKKFAGWVNDSNMASTYVHLSGSDVSNKLLANAGLIDSKIITKKQTTLMQIECPRCKKLNPATDKYCLCGMILDLQEATKKLQEEQTKKVEDDKKFEILSRRMELMEKVTQMFRAEDMPEMLKLAKDGQLEIQNEDADEKRNEFEHKITDKEYQKIMRERHKPKSLR